MGMVIAHDLAHDLGGLAVRPIGGEAHLVHAEEDATMDRLESVADVGQRAPHDHAHRVIQVRRFHLVFDRDVA